MKDFAIWYDGMIIGYVKADTLRKAQNLANRMYSGTVKAANIGDRNVQC